MNVVEKAKNWLQSIPAWLPVVLACIAVCMYIQRLSDKVDMLEGQMQEVQQYLRSHHAKNDSDDYIPGISSSQQIPSQDARSY